MDIHDKSWFQDHLGGHEGRGSRKIDDSHDVPNLRNWSHFSCCINSQMDTKVGISIGVLAVDEFSSLVCPKNIFIFLLDMYTLED